VTQLVGVGLTGGGHAPATTPPEEDPPDEELEDEELEDEPPDDDPLDEEPPEDELLDEELLDEDPLDEEPPEDELLDEELLDDDPLDEELPEDEPSDVVPARSTPTDPPQAVTKISRLAATAARTRLRRSEATQRPLINSIGIFFWTFERRVSGIRLHADGCAHSRNIYHNAVRVGILRRTPLPSRNMFSAWPETYKHRLRRLPPKGGSIASLGGDHEINSSSGEAGPTEWGCRSSRNKCPE
jgi:hypothetical protein